MRSMRTLVLMTVMAWSYAAAVMANDFEEVVECTGHMRILIPEQALSRDAVKVESNEDGRRFEDWTNEQHAEAYLLMQKVAAVWQEHGISDYLIIGDEDSSGQFAWEIVPFPPDEYAFWKQINVMRRIFFGGVNLSKKEQATSASRFRHFASKVPVMTYPEEEDCQGCDPFCNPQIIEAQAVINDPDKSVRVLYDYKPLAYYHFLIVPKAHEEKFSDVSIQSYIEASEYAQELIRRYGKGKAVYLFHKTGQRAGQTVPHWHWHVVIANSREEELYGQFNAFFKMLWGGSALDADTLKERVCVLKSELND